MNFALLFYYDESQFPESELPSIAAEMTAVREALTKAGAWRDAQRLCPPETAATQRVRDGKVLVTDGPFIETKECLAGFWLIDCADLDEALAWAARVPLARFGSVEVRPTRACEG
jgi:hypothetical protein